MKLFAIMAAAFPALFFFSSPSHAAPCSSVAGNLVQNCGFETGDFSSWTLSGADVPSEEGNLYGVEGVDPYPTPAGTNPTGGDSQAYFSDFPSETGGPTILLQQSLATTVGQSYNISFYLAQEIEGLPASTKNTDPFLASFGGVQFESFSLAGNDSYALYTATVTASSASSLLQFQFGDQIGEYLIDDISVAPAARTAVPEPLTMSLFGAGLVGAAAMRRRKSKQASKA